MRLAGCIIKNSDGKVLLLHRTTPKRTQWEIPGGIIEEDETPEQAAVREVKEEVDIEVRVSRQIGDKSFEEDGVHHEYHWFEAEIMGGVPRLTGSDEGIHDDIRYFSLAEMRQSFGELSANTKNFVEAVERKAVTL